VTYKAGGSGEQKITVTVEQIGSDVTVPSHTSVSVPAGSAACATAIITPSAI